MSNRRTIRLAVTPVSYRRQNSDTRAPRTFEVDSMWWKAVVSAYRNGRRTSPGNDLRAVIYFALKAGES